MDLLECRSLWKKFLQWFSAVTLSGSSPAPVPSWPLYNICCSCMHKPITANTLLKTCLCPWSRCLFMQGFTAGFLFHLITHSDTWLSAHVHQWVWAASHNKRFKKSLPLTRKWSTGGLTHGDRRALAHLDSANNPRRRGENMQTSHRKARRWVQTRRLTRRKSSLITRRLSRFVSLQLCVLLQNEIQMEGFVWH